MSDDMSVFLPPVAPDPTPTPAPQQAAASSSGDTGERDYANEELYKKWFRTKDRQGFLSITHWFDAGKLSIDIGEIVGGGVNNTKVWVNAIELLCYLDAVVSGRHDALYKNGGFAYFGGGNVEGKPVSRVLKIDPADDAFWAKCGHFKAKQGGSGAFIPEDMKNPISANQIKLSFTDIATARRYVDLAVTRYAVRGGDDAILRLRGEGER